MGRVLSGRRLVAACAVVLAPSSLLLTVGCGGGGDVDRSELIEALRSNAERVQTEAESKVGAGRSPAVARIEELGAEASGAERGAIIAGFRAYFDALAAHDLSAACTQLSKRIRSLFERLASRTSGGDCETALERLSRKLLNGAGEKANGKVRKVRVVDGNAYVIFNAPGADLYQMRMVRQGGTWKAGGIASAVLVPSS